MTPMGTRRPTLLSSAVGQFGEFVQLWGLQSPAGGSADIVTSGISGGDFTFVAAYSLYNVKQTYTVQSGTHAQGGSSSSISITPNSANNWIIDAIEAEPVPSISGSNTQDYALNGVPNSYDNGEGSSIIQSGGPTQVAMAWSLSYGGRSNQAAVALEPAPSNSTETTVYYYANDELIAKKDNSGTKTYFHNDHLGSTSVVTNQAGSLVETTTYDPWGEVKSGGTASKYLYTGQEHDTETGLHYYNARYYNPEIRRFTQADPIIQNIYDPQTLNRYSYVRNNPLRYTDPSGHFISSVLSIWSTYNMVKNIVSAVSGKTKQTSQSSSSNNSSKTQDQPSKQVNPSSSTVASGGDHPESDTGGARDVAKPLYNFLIGDDIKTFNNQNATILQRGWAGIGIVGAVLPPAKIGKAPKVAESLIDMGKKFNPDQAALIDLAKDAKRTGVSEDEAKILVDWAKEYGLPHHDIMSHPNRRYGQFPHINIGSQNHIYITE